MPKPLRQCRFHQRIKLTDINSLPQTPEEDQAELYCYDRKVHAACTSMIKATTLELKILGVPFFGMKSDLIVCNTDVAEDVVISDAGWKAREGKIEEKELEKLQRKMLELLEDLCKE